MAFYIRKSVSLGPLRFNLSSGGLGVSAGVRGLRVGTGPRGNYVHMGRHGLYYRQTVLPTAPAGTPVLPQSTPHSDTHAPLQELGSADAGTIRDSSSEDLLAELREKRRKLPLLPVALVAGALFLLVALGKGWPWWLLLASLGAYVVAVVAARRRDKLAKTVVILYDFEPAVEAAFKQFCDWTSAIAASRCVWHVDAAGRVYDRKYHAGASQLVRRSLTTVREQAPPYVTTNVPVHAIKAGRNSLFLFPDRLLIYNGSDIGAISYASLEIAADTTRFIEESSVPADAHVVDYTWRYVNKSGGPDRRFSNNRQLPICLYDELTLRTASGLNELLQLSRSGIGPGFVAAVRNLAEAAPHG
jgi:hypothetical protein